MNDWGFCSNGKNLKNLPRKGNYSLSCKQKNCEICLSLQISIWRLMHGCQKTFFFLSQDLYFDTLLFVEGDRYPVELVELCASWPGHQVIKKKLTPIMRGPNMNYSKFLKVVSFLTFRAYLLTQSNSLQIALISLIISWSNHVLVYLCRR